MRICFKAAAAKDIAYHTYAIHPFSTVSIESCSTKIFFMIMPI